MIKKSVLALFVTIITASGIFAQEKMTIAVLDLQPKGTSKIVAGVVTDIIRSEMIKTGLYIVIERSQMAEVLKEQSFQMTGCVEQSCAIQIGKMLSARKVLMGELGMVGKSYMITVRIVDVEKGASEFAANEKADSEDAIDAASVNITRKLSQNIVEGNPEYFVKRITRTGYYSRAIVPGWAQMYAGQETKGIVYMSAFAASLVFMGYTLYDYTDKKKAYEDQKPPQSAIDAKADEYEKASDMTLYAGILAGAVYVAHWVDVLFFTKPEFTSDSKKAGLINRNEGLSFAACPFSGDMKENRYHVSYIVRF